MNNNKMDETEDYLNKILQKRLGSVINQSASIQKGSTVTRLPRQEERVESMPTVFRKKHETIYNPNEEQSKRTSFGSLLQQPDNVEENSTKPVGSHRIEYMAISKRLEQKKDNNLISPTVDVTKYRTTLPVNAVDNPAQTKIQSIKQEKTQLQDIGKEDALNNEKRTKRRKIFG